MSGKASAKKALKIFSCVLLYTLLAVGVLSVLFTLTAKRSETGAVQLFGYQFLTVESASMEKNPQTDVSAYKIKDIPEHSLVFVQVKPKDISKRNEWYASLKVGDVLSFRYSYVQQVTVTHRITDITENGEGGYIIKLKGDNAESSTSVQTINTSLDGTSENYIIGRVTGQSRLLGNFLYAMRTPLGSVLIIILPCFVIILIEILRIVSVLNKNRQSKMLEEQQLKDEEIQALKKRIAELEEEQSSESKK